MRFVGFVAAIALAVSAAGAAWAQLGPPPGPPGSPPPQPPAQPPGGQPPPPPTGAQALVGCFAGNADVKAAVGGRVVESKRRLVFILEPSQNGFNTAWASLEQAAGGGEAVRRLTRVDFTRSNNVYLGKAQTQQGQAESGSAYFARIVGTALIIQTIAIEQDGRFVTSTYTRQVQGNAMALRYVLYYDGQAARVLQGQLQRIDCAQLRTGGNQ
jgi:hypothetical protein